MTDGQWSWNYPSSDWWSHDLFETKEEAIADAKENYDVHNEDVEVGQCFLIPLPTYVDSDRILESLDEQYGEELSEWDDSLFNSVTNKQQQELENELAEVIQKFYKKVEIKSTCWSVNNISSVYVN